MGAANQCDRCHVLVADGEPFATVEFRVTRYREGVAGLGKMDLCERCALRLNLYLRSKDEAAPTPRPPAPRAKKR